MYSKLYTKLTLVINLGAQNCGGGCSRDIISQNFLKICTLAFFIL